MTIPSTILMHGETPEISFEGVTYKADASGTFELPRHAAKELINHGLRIGKNPKAKEPEPEQPTPKEEVKEEVKAEAPIELEIPDLPKEAEKPKEEETHEAPVKKHKGKHGR